MFIKLLFLIDQWDIMLDDIGSMVIIVNFYVVVQDVVCVCLIFFGEFWYDIMLGILYYE